MSNSIQSVNNNVLFTVNGQQNYTVSEVPNNSFATVMNNTKNAKTVAYSMFNNGISNVPTGIVNKSIYQNVYNNYSDNLYVPNNQYVNEIVSSDDMINSINSSNNVEISNSNLTQKQQIEDAVLKASRKYGVDANLIKAVIKTESNFKVNAVSSAGAKGLMQIMPANFKSLGITNPFDIYQNIDGGTKLLKEYMDRYNGDVEMALMAYNGGPGRMKRRGVTSVAHIYKMPKETQNYVKKVMNYYKGV